MSFRSKGGMNDSHDAAISIDEFFRSFKKGSKSCRKILSKREVMDCSITEATSVITFFNLISEPIAEQYDLSFLYGAYPLCRTGSGSFYSNFLIIGLVSTLELHTLVVTPGTALPV